MRWCLSGICLQRILVFVFFFSFFFLLLLWLWLFLLYINCYLFIFSFECVSFVNSLVSVVIISVGGCTRCGVAPNLIHRQAGERIDIHHQRFTCARGAKLSANHVHQRLVVCHFGACSCRNCACCLRGCSRRRNESDLRS